MVDYFGTVSSSYVFSSINPAFASKTSKFAACKLQQLHVSIYSVELSVLLLILGP